MGDWGGSPDVRGAGGGEGGETLFLWMIVRDAE